MPLTLDRLRHAPTARRLQGEDFTAKNFVEFQEAMIAGFMLDGYSVVACDNPGRQEITYTFWRVEHFDHQAVEAEFFFLIKLPAKVLRVETDPKIRDLIRSCRNRNVMLDALRNVADQRKRGAQESERTRPSVWERLR